jgi:hypothetical protein
MSSGKTKMADLARINYEQYLLQRTIRRSDKRGRLLHADNGQARPSQPQQPGSSLPRLFGAPRARLAWRLGGFVTTCHE